jgi:uncharacterized membrane protein YgdD (TMEM256/DUF423 family)
MSHVWHKLAALSGASAVGAAAFGAHVLPSQASDAYFEKVFERSNTMHLMASALLGIAPIARKPGAVGGLASVGALLFCSRWAAGQLGGGP